VIERHGLIPFAILSVIAALVTIGLKATAYAVTGSVGLLSDALESLVNLAAALVAQHHAGLAVEAREAADDGEVVREGAVAVQLLEVGEDVVDVVERVGPLRVARDLRHLPGRKRRPQGPSDAAEADRLHVTEKKGEQARLS